MRISRRFIKSTLYKVLPFFMLGMIFVELSERVWNERPRLFRTFRVVQKPPPGPTKVVLVTYMRGGSTFLGELFNQHRNACYWYEPLEGIFHTMYGYLNVMQPLDLLFNPDGTRRELTTYERRHVNYYMLRLLDEPFPHSLPTELLYSRIVIDRHVRWNLPFQKCLKKYFGSKINWIWMYKQRRCRKCFPEPSLQEMSTCHYSDPMTHNTSHGQLMFNSPDLSKCPKAKIKCHFDCMEKIAGATQSCLHLVDQHCANRSINAIKTIRFTMHMAEGLLKKDPRIKIVYYVRDPRGIYISRRDVGEWMHSKVSQGKWITEIKFLCRRMMEDINAMKRLRKERPRSVLFIRYEDFAEHPLKYANLVYKHIAKPMPPLVREWLVSNTKGAKESGDFGTKRANSTKTAYAWVTKINHGVHLTLNGYCREVLKEFGYPEHFS